ncbi:MAG TPA: esterase [Alphaproteobacteria bacterium]|nr:esterase [Alphaproteobacteria bacterium]
MKAGVENAAKYIRDVISEISEKHKIPYNRIILLGFSQGGMLALHTGLTIEKEIAGIISFSGALVVSNLEELNIRSKPKTLLVHGVDDEVVPYDRSVAANEKLKEAGVDVQMHSIKGLSHSIDYNCIEIAKGFIKTLF